MAKLFSDTAQQDLAEKSKNIPFDYSLDGESARSMSAENFVALLHKYGLTVKDAVEYQCKKKEEEIYKELTKIAELTEHDWQMLQNLWNLKEEFLTGHYDEDNIKFKGDFKPETIQTIRDTLKKADIPFNVTVVTKNTAKIVPSEDMAREDKCGSIWTEGDILWDEDTGQITSFGYFDIEFYINEKVFTNRPNALLNTAVHEVTHLLNMHTYQEIFFKEYLIYRKGIDANKIDNYTKPLNSLIEYQADVLPLAVDRYALAAMHTYDIYTCTIKREDIYVQQKDMYQLASRAIGLHKAEAELLKSNRIEGKIRDFVLRGE